MPLYLEQASADEALLTLAREAKINIIVDADDLPPAGKTITITPETLKYKNPSEGWLVHLSHEFGLTWDRSMVFR